MTAPQDAILDRPPADQPPPLDNEYVETYRALSAAAVCALVMGLLSGLAFLDWTMAVVPVVGLIVGFTALQGIRARPNDLTGAPLAWVGSALSLFCLVGGMSYLGYTYATEVPDGYERLSYEALQPDPKIQGEVVPPSAAELEGKQVFVKGYVFPGDRQSGITRFMLVRDRGTCCFGGNPKITDRILVSLRDAHGLDYSTNEFKIAGVFHFRPQSKSPDTPGGVYYELSEAFVR